MPVILFTADEDFERYQSRVIDAVVIKSPDFKVVIERIAELLSSETIAELA
jgi:hypothetical protein